jgi:site-specific recombinase XerD
LAYADVEKLSPNQIGRGVDGKHWIFTDRTKTKTSSNIPLLSPALAILKKYQDDPEAVNKGRIFPVTSNQKMNAYLKEIADLCGIAKTLTTHVARHTFATTVTLTNGVPLETVSSMLGHKNVKTTQIYAKVVQKKISHDMDKLEQQISSKTQAGMKESAG